MDATWNLPHWRAIVNSPWTAQAERPIGPLAPVGFIM